MTSSCKYIGNGVAGREGSGIINLLGNGLNNDWRVKTKTPVGDLKLGADWGRRWTLGEMKMGMVGKSDNETGAEYDYRSHTTINTQLTGKHTLEHDNIEWSGSYSYTNRRMPDRRRYTIDDALEQGTMMLTAGNEINREFINANKVYEDVLYDAVGKKVIDENQKSYSNTFFLEALKNKAYDDAAVLDLKDASKVGSPFMPSAASPLLTLASFDGETSAWFDKVSYVGAFNSTDNWLTGWANFDPQNTKY